MSSINKDISQLKKIILDAAIRGKLVPQDENDEDAGVLLEKIKAEKEKLIKEGKIKKDKPLPEIKPEEIPFEIPKSWRWVRLGEIGTLQGGKRLPLGDTFAKEKTDHMYIRVKDMKNNSINEEDPVYITNETYSKISNYIISKNDLYITIAGTIGAVGEIPNRLDGMNLTENASKFSPIIVNKKYLMNLIETKYIQENWKSIQAQAVRPKLSLIKIKNTVIPLPPVFEQQSIVAKIESLFKLADEIDTRRISLVDKVKALKATILQEAIQGKLVPQDENDEDAGILLEKIKAEKEKLIKEGEIKKDKPLPEIKPEEIPFEIPKSWRWVRLNEIFDVRDGTHDTPKYTEKGYPLVTSKNLVNGNLSFDDIKNISEADYNQIRLRSKVEKGDILFAMIGTIGNPVIVDVEKDFAIKNVALFKKIIEDKNTIKYLYYYLVQQVDLMKQKSAGGVQSFVPLGFLRNYVFPLPPETEQQRIVAKIEELFKSIDLMLEKTN